MKTNSKQKGFTLIEILVATAIFATVMVIVVGTFSWVASYNNRLKETRRVGQEVRNAMDQLTRDIRLANGSGKNARIGSFTVDIGEITLLYCSGSSTSTCSPRFQTEATRYADLSIGTDPSASGQSISSNAVLILKKDSEQAVLYRSVLISGENYKFTVATRKDLTNFDSLKLSGFDSPTVAPIIIPVTTHPSPPDKSPMSMQVFFGGYGATKALRTQQPYAEIYMIGKTYDYSKILPNMRSKFHLRTMIETRDYNP